MCGDSDFNFSGLCTQGKIDAKPAANIRHRPSQMSDAAAEQRIIGGIPVYVAKGAPTEGTIPISTWTEQRHPIGTYTYGVGGGFNLNISAAATESLAAWRAAQVPRPRAELRVSR
jgi:hypothetical protein